MHRATDVMCLSWSIETQKRYVQCCRYAHSTHIGPKQPSISEAEAWATVPFALLGLGYHHMGTLQML